MNKRYMLITGLSLITVFILLAIFLPIYQNDKYQKSLYNDFVATSNAKSIAFQKELDMYSNMVNENDKYFETRALISTEDIIYNFAQYDYLPMLEFLDSASDNIDLVQSFRDFTYYYNSLIYYEDLQGEFHGIIDLNPEEGLLSKDISSTQKEIQIKKYVISKNYLNLQFSEYLTYNSLSDNYFYIQAIDDNLVREALLISYTNNNPSPASPTDNELATYLETNYSLFYEQFKDVFDSLIANILDTFIEFLQESDQSTIEYESVVSTYLLVRNVKLQDMPSKYYTYNWSVDIVKMVSDCNQLGVPFYIY